MSEQNKVQALIAAELTDPDTSWSLGTFGAIAEFVRDRGEDAEVRLERRSVFAVTDRGGIRFENFQDIRLVAYETVSKNAREWGYAVALCLPAEACEMNRRRVLTEIGPDRGAICEEDRDAILFDIGVGALQVDVCIRTENSDLIAILRAAAGQSLFAPGNRALGAIVTAGPHRVFSTRLGRSEVFQGIPPASGESPAGPHTHLLPKLLRSGRTHAATEPIPDGLAPCAHFYPPNATRGSDNRSKRFDQNRRDSQALLLERYGDPELIALKQRVAAAVRAGGRPQDTHLPHSRFARTAVRVALQQLLEADPTLPSLAGWLSHFERIAIGAD